jgi:hypothetical protein
MAARKAHEGARMGREASKVYGGVRVSFAENLNLTGLLLASGYWELIMFCVFFTLQIL